MLFTAFLDEDVQHPNTVATPSLSINFSAFVANVDGSDAPSSSTYSICLPNTPPDSLIYSIASTSASLTASSLIAIEPVRE